MAEVELAGLSADIEGVVDSRAPLVLMHGLTWDRRSWGPVLAHLRRADPGRRVLALDLPGHGRSPARSSHNFASTIDAVHQAVQEAVLEAPVLVGHHHLLAGRSTHLSVVAPAGSAGERVEGQVDVGLGGVDVE